MRVLNRVAIFSFSDFIISYFNVKILNKLYKEKSSEKGNHDA